MSDPSFDPPDAVTPGPEALGACPAEVLPPLDFSGPFTLAAETPDREDTPEPVTAEETAPEAPPHLDPAALAARLVEVSFGDRGFLLAHAAEAGRAAIEMIRNAQRLAGRAKRTRIIACVGPGGSAAHLPAGFADADGVDILATDDPGAILTQITPKTAGIVIAPVRSDGRFEILSGNLLAELRQAADEYGITLVFDETFSGLGRSGMMWAHEWRGVTPDLMISGQGLAGDLPLAVLIASAKVAKGAAGLGALDPARLDPAIVAAAAIQLDRLLSPGFDTVVQARAWRLEDHLATLRYQHPERFTDTIGLGLMQGLVCREDATALSARLAEEGLETRAFGTVLALFPALTVREEEIDAARDILVCALA